ncbi:hypothetical protein GCM10011578_076120 [Streptomyces fuscichromogenes]|uniref:Uncharacterized protein n=1 Tax=Streptomyces fuscichromogenes TaxID=1324013 RepID=A0A917XKL5_9ACTN|nr:hypothetical protein GCM10011578_076120 [Streptomyces fuscichromogenes]
MTGPGVPPEPRPPAEAGAPFATHKPCPVDGCPGPARVPVRSAAHPPVVVPRDPGRDEPSCRRCGAGPRGPMEG